MNENQDKIYLDQQGYEKYLKEIQDLKTQLANNGVAKSEAYTNAVGDGWHDNFAFEEAKREEFKILGLLQSKIQGLSKIEIVNNSVSEELIGINDFVTIDMIFGDDEPEELSFKLIASSTPDLYAEIKEVSINSPLGKNVYQKKIGDMGSYTVNGDTISFAIKNNIKTLKQQEETAKILKKE